MGVIEDARELVKTAQLSEDFLKYAEDGYYWDGQFSNGVSEFSTDILACSLSYQIELDGGRISDERAVKIGASKYRGLPHMPPEMPWPEAQFFALQLNLADLAKLDKSARLPTSGMLYFFFNGGADSTVIHWDGDISSLEVREYPDPETLPGAKYYLDDFLKGELVTLKPYWLFYFNQGDAYDYSDVRSLLPNELVDAVSAKVGTGIGAWDSSCRLYGRPHNWQGEDEGMGAPTDFDDAGMPIWEESEPELLLFQDEFGEGNIHFWGEPEAVAKGDFSEVWLGYSGT